MCSATSQHYINYQHSTLIPHNGGNGFIRNYNMSPSAKKSSISIRTIILAFSVVICLFTCLMTATFCLKSNTENIQQINRLVGTVELAIHDLNTLTDLIRKEILAKRVTTTYMDHHKAKTIGNDYEYIDEDYTDGDRFMGKDLMDNYSPSKTYEATGQHNSKTRQRRNAVVDATKMVKNQLNSSKNEKTDVEIIQEENTVKTNSGRKSKKMGSLKKKILSVEESEEEELYENLKETQETAAAHFTSDSSKYSIKTHKNYEGNGRIKHPDGDFRDWTQYLWDKNNANHFIMKNGKVEVLKPGLYFVYAQIYYSDKHDINGYYVMKNDENVLGCTSTRHQDNQSSDSCYTGGLIYFNSKDNLTIRGLGSDRFIILDPVKSFFGLFKISNESKR